MSDNLSSSGWSRHLDGLLVVNTKQGYIGHTNEGPLLTGPEFNHRALLWSFRGCIEISEAHTAKVGGQTDQNVPTNSNRIKFIHYQKHPNMSLKILFISIKWLSSTTCLIDVQSKEIDSQVFLLLLHIEWIEPFTHQAQWRYGKFTYDHISQKIRSLIQHMSARVHHSPERRPSLNTRRFSHLYNTNTNTKGSIIVWTVHCLKKTNVWSSIFVLDVAS